MDDLYREHILEHYKHPQNFGTLDPHDLEFQDLNPLCGDELKVEIVLDGDRIADLRFAGQGCAISQAAASMVSEEVKGLRLEELMKLDREFVLELLGIPISATRMKCAMLSLKVLKGAGMGVAAAWPTEEASAGG